MEDEEIKKLSEIELQIQERLRIIEKLENDDDNKVSKESIQATIKDLHVERGRLIKIYKNNKKFIDELYLKYDLFINVLEIIAREENENYSKADKMNDIKNTAIANDYSEFEKKLLEVINDNIDDISKLKSELEKIDVNGDIRKIADIKKCYSEQLKKHKDNINERYSKEFIHKKATIPSLVTVLPKAVALAIKKVAVCIDERKEAKTNKEKFNKIGKIFASIGQLIATPIIYAGKFVIDHWYLLLLLLMMFPDLFPFLRGKNKDSGKNEKQEQHQEQEAYETESELVPSTATNPSQVENPVIENTPEKVSSSSTFGKPAIDYSKDPRFVAKPNPGLVNATEQTASLSDLVPQISESEQSVVNDISKGFIDNLERNYNFFIASRHPDVTVVHSAEEYVQKVLETNPYANIDVSNAAQFYNRYYSQIMNSQDATIIWPEVTNTDLGFHFFANETELANYLASGQESNLNDYYKEFITRGGNVDLFSKIGDIVNTSEFGETIRSLGISSSAAVVLFCLYEAGKLALVPSTGGATLALP